MSHITRKKDLIEKDLKKAFKWFFILVMFLFVVSIIATIVFSTDKAIAQNKNLEVSNFQISLQNNSCNDNCFKRYNDCQNDQSIFCSKKLDSCLSNCYD